MNKEAKVTLFAIVSLAILVAVVWQRQRDFEQQEQRHEDPIAYDVGQDDRVDSRVVIETTAPDSPAPGHLPGAGPVDNDSEPRVVLGPDSAQTPPDNTAPTDLDQPAPVGPALPPQPVEHTVQAGDNLWAISRQYFGDASHRNAIYEANRDRLRSPNDLTVGQKLIIPMQAAAQPAAPDNTDSHPAQADASRTHTVAPGDTLARIARTYYNDPRKASVIFQANRDKLNDPDVLKVGTVLRIP